MSQDNLTKLECTQCSRINYFTKKNKKTLAKQRLDLSKFCKHCGAHIGHKETK